jgi:hypothetical protein
MILITVWLPSVKPAFAYIRHFQTTAFMLKFFVGKTGSGKKEGAA